MTGINVIVEDNECVFFLDLFSFCILPAVVVPRGSSTYLGVGDCVRRAVGTKMVAVTQTEHFPACVGIHLTGTHARTCCW